MGRPLYSSKGHEAVVVNVQVLNQRLGGGNGVVEPQIYLFFRNLFQMHFGDLLYRYFLGYISLWKSCYQFKVVHTRLALIQMKSYSSRLCSGDFPTRRTATMYLSGSIECSGGCTSTTFWWKRSHPTITSSLVEHAATVQKEIK